MTQFMFNDGGRSATGFKGHTGDCATRAIAIGTGMEYREVYELIKEYGAKERRTKKVRRKGPSHPRTGVWGNTMRKIMDDLGWEWVPTMKVGQGCKVHLTADELPKGTIIIRASRHYTTMIDGVIHDTFDPSRDGTRCVYGYWKKPEKEAPLPKPVKWDGRICFSIEYYETEDDANRVAAEVERKDLRYNGGFYHGRPCGRDPSWDYFDKELGKQLYAVTT